MKYCSSHSEKGNHMPSFWSYIQSYIASHANQAEGIGFHALDVIALIVVLYIAARIVIRLLTRFIHRFLKLRAVKLDERRRNTLTSLSENAIRYTIYTVYVLLILPKFGLHIEALLAGAGIAGVAIGFGAQSLIKDLITGFFILFEDQYAVGDMVTINSFTGTVLTIGLRLTRIQASTGEIEIIPNGQITNVTNYSKTNSIAVIDVSIDYRSNLDAAIHAMEEVMGVLQAESSEIIGEVSVLGVQEFKDAAIVIRATAECVPLGQYSVQRLARKKMKEVFDRNGIEMSFINQTVILKKDN
jgi:moderate conductance mechanosensitive channel